MRLQSKKNNELLKQHIPTFCGIELTHTCQFECTFCVSKSSPFGYMPYDDFVEYVDLLIANGITTIDLTPADKGDVYVVPEFWKYIQYLENHPKINNYFFHFSMGPKKDLIDTIDKVLKVVNNSTKALMLFSCYWTDGTYETFHRITRCDEAHFEYHKKNVYYIFKNVKADRMIFINRILKEVPIKGNKLLRLCKIKNIKMIREDDDTVLHWVKDDSRTNKLCDQYLCGPILKLNGDIAICNFAEGYNTPFTHISDLKERNTFNDLLTNKWLDNKTCKTCLINRSHKEQTYEAFAKNYEKVCFKNGF